MVIMPIFFLFKLRDTNKIDKIKNDDYSKRALIEVSSESPDRRKSIDLRKIEVLQLLTKVGVEEPTESAVYSGKVARSE